MISTYVNPTFTEGEAEVTDPPGRKDKGKGSTEQKSGKGNEEQKEGEEQKNGGFSGVRKKIMHPSEALDSARQTAELIMKDAIDALMRTKQRLLEILPSLTPSQSADDASKIVEKVDSDVLAKSEGAMPQHVAQAPDGVSSPVAAITTNPTSMATTTSPQRIQNPSSQRLLPSRL